MKADIKEIKSRVKKKGIKVTVMCRKINLSRFHYYEVLRGNRELTEEVRGKLYEFLEIK